MLYPSFLHLRTASGPDIGQRYFFALARTRASNTELRIGVCAVWNGFSIVCKQGVAELMAAGSAQTRTFT